MKDPLFIHINSLISPETRRRLELISAVRQQPLDQVVKTELARFADSITVEELALEVATSPTLKPSVRGANRGKKYKHHTKRRECPTCGERFWPQGITRHTRVCQKKNGQMPKGETTV